MVSHHMIALRMQEEIDDLRAALAQPDELFCDTHCTWRDHHPDCFMARTEKGPEPEQEPVMFNGLTEAETNASASVMGLTPPKRKPLTEKEIGKATEHIAGMHCAIVDEIARAIEAAHGIGGEE